MTIIFIKFQDLPWWASLIILLALCVCFWMAFVFPKKRTAKDPSNSQPAQNKFKMSKGMKTLIGALLGMCAEAFIFSYLAHDSFELTEWTFLLLLPGAIIGAVIGFATEIYDVKSDKKEKPTVIKQDAASELTSFKKLLDDGIITQEEFDKKKQEILERE